MSDELDESTILTRSRFRMLPPFGRVFASDILKFEDFISAWPIETHGISAFSDNFHRWHRIFLGALRIADRFKGPMLDIASGNGIIYPAVKKFVPQVLPYSITEIRLDTSELTIDGDKISKFQFECDKEVIPLADRSYGVISFLDVLEHLIVDPMWTLLEFNRVLREGGHLILSTPNAGSFDRILYLMMGQQPGTETDYKPTSIYQRHNREWVPVEVTAALRRAGFELSFFETYQDLFPEEYNDVYMVLRKLLGTTIPPTMLGPEIVIVAQKMRHVTLSDDLSDDERWPNFLYTGLKNYHRRPKVYPIVVSDDYE